MKKTIISSMIVLTVTAQILTGCGSGKAKTKVVDPSTTDKAVTEPSDNDQDNQKDSNSIYEKYNAVGQIAGIIDGKVSLLSGDIMEDFENVKGIEKCYIGETIGLIKKGNGYELEKIKVDNSIRHTSMGMLIERIEGIIKDVSDQQVVVTTTDGDVTIVLHEPIKQQVGDEVIVDYMSADAKNMYAIYSKKHALELTVDKIDRVAATGVMLLHTKDNKDLLYDVYVMAGTDVNFNLSDVEEGSKITVYADTIREIYPNEVDATMIQIIKEEN